MDNEYTDKIEALLGDYYEYRRAKESSKKTQAEPASVPYSKHCSFPFFDDESKEFKWFPQALSEIEQEPKKEDVSLAQYQPPSDIFADDLSLVKAAQLQKDGISAGSLSDNVAKVLEPFAVLEVDKMDYEGSPIYEDLDKETVAQMTVSAYNNAVLNVSELGDIEAQSACFSKEQMIRALIRELIIKEIFFIKRARYW